MPQKLDVLQKILQDDPLPRVPLNGDISALIRYSVDLNRWLERLILKLTSENIQNGLDSIV